MKNKILFFTEKWTSGGAESFVMNLVRNLNYSEFEVSILTTQNEWDGFENELKCLNILKYVILDEPIYNPIWRVFKTIQVFGKNLTDKNIDIIHLNIYNGVGLIYAYIAKRKGIPVIIAHSHNTDIVESKFKFLKVFAHTICKQLLANYPTYFFGCSDKALDFLCSKKNRYRSEMIPNAIDMDKFYYNDFIRKKVREELNITDKLIIGNVGRLNSQKNQIFLLEIFSKILIEIPNAVLCIVGTGELEKELKEHATELNIFDNVIWYGACNKINEIYQAFDVFVMTSKFEGLPIALLEAQVADLPCVISDVIDSKVDLLDGRNIIRISLNSSKTLWAKRIINATSNKNRTNLKLLLDESEFHIKQMIINLEKKYKMLIGGTYNE